MVRVLLDTCVLSEVRRPEGHPGVRRALEGLASEALYLSVITLGELVKGVSLLSVSKRKQALQAWVLSLEQHYENHILPINAETVHIWGELTARTQKDGVIVPVSDGLIAATALQHGLQLMTRNVKDFAATGVMLLNPWE